MSSTQMIEERLRRFVVAVHDADWQEVLDRAEASQAAVSRRCWRAAAGRRWRPVMAAAVALTVLAGVGAAIAAGFGAFNGIGAAQHPRSGADALDPKIVAALQSGCSGPSPIYDPGCHLVLDSARLVSRLPTGRNVYVVTDTRGDLCVVVQDESIGCGPALGPSHPATVEESNRTGNDPVAFGLAIDGVTGVSFMAGGHEVTVPVNDNVWVYEGENSAINSLTVHFDDGSTQTIR